MELAHAHRVYKGSGPIIKNLITRQNTRNVGDYFRLLIECHVFSLPLISSLHSGDEKTRICRNSYKKKPWLVDSICRKANVVFR